MMKLISIYEEYNCWNGLYLYLNHIINNTKGSVIIFKYIRSAMEIEQIQCVINICYQNNYYDAKQVKDYLLNNNGNKIKKDPRALIHVCDRYKYTEELINYLYVNNMFEFIHIYVTQMNISIMPKVIGILLDLNPPKNKIKELINSINPYKCCIKELVNEIEKRNSLFIILDWLEQRFNEGCNDINLYNALAKIYINININNAKHFLLTNQYYDNYEIGKYCETIDPYLSYICYKRSLDDNNNNNNNCNKCDKELINITNKNNFFKEQARYCVPRQNKEL